MTISVRLEDDDAALIKKYAALHNISLSDLIRQTLIEKIEDEYDLAAYNRTTKEFQKDSTTYTLDEVEKELGLL